MAFTVSLSNEAVGNVTVDYATSNGTASQDNDYAGTTGTLTIPAGQMNATINVPMIEDAELEDDEDFTMTLSNATRGTLGDDDDTATGTIIDNEPVISIADASAEEGAPTMAFTVSLSNEAVGNMTVDYATSNGTASQANDYAGTTGTLTIPAGQMSTTINVPMIEDAEPEDAEDFTMTLSNVTGGALGDDDTATGTIIDNEPVISIADASAEEHRQRCIIALDGNCVERHEYAIKG